MNYMNYSGMSMKNILSFLWGTGYGISLVLLFIWDNNLPAYGFPLICVVITSVSILILVPIYFIENWHKF